MSIESLKGALRDSKHSGMPITLTIHSSSARQEFITLEYATVNIPPRPALDIFYVASLHSRKHYGFMLMIFTVV